MATRIELIQVTAASRMRYERAWGDDTAHPDFRPLPDGMPDSYGHCSLATCELLEDLDIFPDENLRIATGVVLQAVQVAGVALQRNLTPKGHVWLDRRHPRWRRGGVLDVTFDQTRCEVLPYKFLVASHVALERFGIVYRTDEFYDSVDEFMASRPARVRAKERRNLFQSR